MATLAEIRAQHPEYDDLTDEQLADGLHKKFYSDMPFTDFAARVGFRPQPTAPTRGGIPARQQHISEPKISANPQRAIVDFLTGNGRRQPGVGEIAWQQAPIQTPFDPGKPETWLDDFGRSAATGLGFFLDPDTESRAKIFMRNYPQGQLRRDEFGNLQVRYNPNTPWAYFNRPGVSVEDAQTLSNEAVKYTPAARAASGAATIGGRAAIAAGASGATRAASDTAAMAVGGDGPTLEDTAISAAIGGVVQPVGDAISVIRQGGTQLLGRVMRGEAPVTGGLHAGPVEMVETGSVNPNQVPGAVRAATADMAQADATAAQRALTRGNEAAAAYQAADEFGVPLTRGQATGDARQIAQEQRWARGGASAGAERVMREQIEDQATALQQAGARLATRGQQPLSQSVDDAGLQLRDEIVARREALEEAADRAYDKAFRAARNERVPASDELSARVNAVVDEQFLDAPGAVKVIDRLQSLIREGRADFGVVERARQQLNRIAASVADDPGQLYAVQRIKNELDTWVDQTIVNKQARDIMANARSVFADLRTLYAQTGPRDAGGRALERVANLDLSGQHVVDAVFGAGTKPNQAALATVRRLKQIATGTVTTGAKKGRVAQKPRATAGAKRFESNSELPTPELQVIREAIIYRALQPLANRPANGALPAQSIATNLRRLLDQEGKEIAEIIFTAQERALMRRYLNVVERLVPPVGTVNHSGTAYEISRMLQSATDALFTGIFSRLPALIFRAPVQTIQGDIRGGLETLAAKRAVNRPMFDIRMSPNASKSVRAVEGYAAVDANDPAYSGEPPVAPYIDPYTGLPVQ